MPLPAIAQIDRAAVQGLGHYWVVERVEDETVTLYDAQKVRRFEQSLSEFAEEWGGHLLVFTDEKQPAFAPYQLAQAEAEQIFGGCCGVQRPESDLGDPDHPNNPDDPCDGQGCPVWRVNPQNMNLYVTDTPLWYSTPYGPDVAIKLSYNAQSAIAGNEVFGNKWILNYGSYLVIDPGKAVTVFMPDGRRDLYTKKHQQYTSEAGHYNRLTRVAHNQYTVLKQDGTTFIYQTPGASQQLFLTRVTDIHGQSITLTYDKKVRLTGITDAQGRTSTLRYGHSGHVTHVTDPFGRTAQFAYDKTGNLTAITDMGGYKSTLRYDADVYLTTLSKPAFGTWRFTVRPADGIEGELKPYSGPDEPMWENYSVVVRDPLGRKTEYYYDGYNEKGFVVRPKHYIDYVDDDNNNYHQPKTRYGYTGSERSRIGSVTDEAGNYRSYAFHANGKLAERRDSTGWHSQYHYNSSHQLASMLENASDWAEYQRQTHFKYRDAIGAQPTLIKRTSVAPSPDHQKQPYATTKIRYDKHRYINTVTYQGYDDSGQAVTPRTLDLDYNDRGQLVRWDGPRTDVQDIYHFTYYDCDEVNRCGRLLSISNALGHTTTIDAYTKGGLPAKVTAPNGLVTEYQYDGLNRLTQRRQSDPGSGDTRTTTLRYRGAKQHLAYIAYPGGRSYTFTYDKAEQLSRVSDALGNRIDYRYDKNGNQIDIARHDASGELEIRIKQAYDLIDHIRQIKVGAVQLDLRLNLNGLITSVDDPSGYRDDYTYDDLNRLIDYNDAKANSTLFQYNVNDALTQVEAPNGVKTQYQYGRSGQPPARGQHRPWHDTVPLRHGGQPD